MSPREERRWNPRRNAEVATRRAMLARDAGLAKISVVTRWMVGGVLALSGGLALIAANAFHGHTIHTTSSSTGATSTSAGQTTPSVTTPATTTAPAVTTPAVTTPAPVVVSGGS